ncbi:LPS-assembly protein LptD [Pseudooceanicola sp. C21-150M6]|uniref:LPS-assembly protein LptD n=1 Tax=Pseudooceanicola sp. C21-150M6 TaxID=3434355 RepID=UPI003D7F366F
MRWLLCALIIWLLPVVALAQSNDDAPSMLVADHLRLADRNTLVAEGSVEVLRGDTRLRAQRIVYSRTDDRLEITGPIVLQNGPDQILIADAAALDRDLRNGLIRGARVLMDQQLQLAAARLDRVDGRYSQLTRATVSSCQVCGTRPPLWQIRARRVVHDQTERQLYFDDARMEVRGVPILWFPRLRLPDPTQTRATGFLIPSIRRNSQLATGVKIPYFIKLGDHRDLTLTPYISARTRTLEWRYRQAFTRGEISFNGALSQDDLQSGTRAFIEGTGHFDLRRDFKLDFKIAAVNDDAYLTDYDYSDADRLESSVTLSRVRRDSFLAAELALFHTLRVNETNDTIPFLAADAMFERRFFPRWGGEIRASAETHSHVRRSDLDFDGADADTIVDGRDVQRMSVGLDWRNSWTLPLGLRAQVLGGVAGDAFITSQDASLPGSDARLSPTAALTLRWPWVRHGATGVTNIVEPVAMIAWTGGDALNVANDESTRVEFDEGNLLSLSRFSAVDRRERGLRAALGATWTRLDPSGWSTRFTLGSVFRERPETAFSKSSGLRGETSDLLIAGQIFARNGLSVTARGLFDYSLEVNKAEAKAVWNAKRFDIAAGYVWLSPDPDEDRPTAVSEWSFSSGFDFNDNWRGLLSGRYDIAADEPIRAGFGVVYSNECLDVTLSASRRFTSSTIVSPATDFSFTIGLRGFSARSNGGTVARACR